jgi:hypothetical protein
MAVMKSEVSRHMMESLGDAHDDAGQLMLESIKRPE